MDRNSTKRIVTGVTFGLLTLVAFCSAGCEAFSTETAVFVAYNTSNDDVDAFVNDGSPHRISANSSTQFTVEVLVPRNRVGTTYGPSQIDKRVQVSVAFRNLRTGRLTQPTICTTGAKVITHIWYEPFFGSDYPRCTSSYGYGAKPEVPQ